MIPVMRRIAAPLFGLVFGLALVWGLGAVARADEFRLNDGSKIVGSIVGYENGAFKVQTSYGFAMVRKESIVEIVVSGKTPPLATPANPALKPAVLPMPAPRLKGANAADQSASAVPNVAPLVSVPVLQSTALSLAAISDSLHPAESLDMQAPPMQEMVRGNVYVNQSYGFQMYKPPAWDVIKNPQKQLPNAVGALGTKDQTTLLVIGRDPMSDSIEARAATTERALRGVYANFRPLDTQAHHRCGPARHRGALLWKPRRPRLVGNRDHPRARQRTVHNPGHDLGEFRPDPDSGKRHRQSD